MKKILVSLILMILVATACAPQAPTEPPSIIINDPVRPTAKPTLTPAPTTEEEPLDSVEEAVIKQLAENLDLQAGDISVVGNETVEFSDACLGVSMPEVMCAQVITPGRIIVLEANGVQYEYHANADGSHTVPATFALTWKREGGIAGFCDDLTVFLSGEVYGNQCNTGDGRMETFASLLSSSERNNFQSWVEQYGELNIDASDPKGVSDRMVVALTFTGTGDEETVSSSDQQALLEFAQSLYQKLYQ